MRFSRTVASGLGIVVAGALMSLPSFAQQAAAVAGRTPWGDPDLQGIYTHGFTVKTPFSVEATASGTRPRGELKVPLRDLVVDPPDGKVPPLTPDADEKRQKRAAYLKERPADSWESLSLWERCLTRALPDLNIPAWYGNTYQILQTPQYVAILYEMVHEARIIPIEGRGGPATSSVRQWLGNSRGRWENDTLIVETTNFTSKTEGDDLMHHVWQYYRAGENLHLTERFTRRDADNLDVRFTVSDPTVYTSPWTGGVVFTRQGAPDRVYEFACHEGNYRIVANQLGAARLAEKEGRRPEWRFQPPPTPVESDR